MHQTTSQLTLLGDCIIMTADGKVNTVDRVMKDVPYPATEIPTDEQLFEVVKENGTTKRYPRIPYLRNHLQHEGRLSEAQVLTILHMTTEHLKREPTLLEVPAPVTICGDVHGQYYDLLKLLDVGGDPEINTYLFMGDYVDRGYFSIECVLLLWALKARNPNKMMLLRGNHECRHLTSYFTFKMECKHKYSINVYEACMASFDALPLAAVVNKQFYCAHGGISPRLRSPFDLNGLNRFREPPTSGLMCDVLWSDPHEDFGDEAVSDAFVTNTTRGCSFNYTYRAVKDFLKRNHLLSVIRAHEAQDAGYRTYKKIESTGSPSVITIFSAPNYLDAYNNKAAVLRYEDNVLNIRQFSASPHPYWLPRFMDVFTWSLPFAGQKVSETLLAILNTCTSEELSQESDPTLSQKVFENSSIPGEKGLIKRTMVQPPVNPAASNKQHDAPDRRLTDEQLQKFRNKILAIARVSRIFNVLREESELISEFKGMSGTPLPKGTLMLGTEGIRAAFNSFEEAKDADRPNEAMPPSQVSETESNLSRSNSFDRK